MNVQDLANAGKRFAEGYRLLFGIGAVAVVLVQTLLTPNLTGWATPWLGSLALTVAVLGIMGMLSGHGQEKPTRLWVAWSLGCVAGLACLAIVGWRAEVDPAVAWPTAALAGIATAVLVAFSETATGDQPARSGSANPPTSDQPGWRSFLPAEALRSAVTLALATLALALHVWHTDATWYQPARVIVGSLYILVVPGWHLSSLFDSSKLDLIERGALALALSLVVVPLGLMWIHFLGGRIDFWATWTLVLALAVISALLNQMRVLVSKGAHEAGTAPGTRLLALWMSRSITQKAILLSGMLWLLAVAGLATRTGL